MAINTNLYDEENLYYDLSDNDEVNNHIVDNNINKDEDEDSEEETTTVEVKPQIKNLNGQKISSISKYLSMQLNILEFNRDKVSFIYKDQQFIGKVLHKISPNKFVFLNTSTNGKKIIDVSLL